MDVGKSGADSTDPASFSGAQAEIECKTRPLAPLIDNRAIDSW